ITAIKNDIAVYAIHTNLDNVLGGVNGKIADMLGLKNQSILSARENSLKKLFTFVPTEQANQVREAIFKAGGGEIGHYSECSFNSQGTGTFKAGPGTNPFAGKPGVQHQETETRVEVIFPSWLEQPVLDALRKAHPYEEVAFDIVPLSNTHPGIGSGVVGELPQPLSEQEFLSRLKAIFGLQLIRHSALTGRPVQKVALCGGAGSFLVSKALSSESQAYVTADMKYHEFFDANGRLLIADIGHYESEQFTIDLLCDILKQKFPTFAVLKTAVRTNPVFYS
ncbi:MAG TPA: Nif3-like dinuclear metal center hexameric protein, partial [Chitinophagaceae bacterium]|nr:Nif3-like dinuclear metal center hexameric protein [Chitinophagaceae bacterium]